MTDYIDQQGFRANVGIVLMRDGGDVFLGGRRRRAWLAVPAGRRAARRIARRRAVPRTARGSRARARRRRAAWRAPAAGCAIGCRASTCAVARARSASARSSAGSCCAWSATTSRAPLRRDRGAGIRRLALGGLLVAGARSHLFQAQRIRTGACRNSRSRAFPGGPPPRPDWWSDELLHAPDSRQADRRRRRHRTDAGIAEPARGDRRVTDARRQRPRSRTSDDPRDRVGCRRWCPGCWRRSRALVGTVWLGHDRVSSMRAMTPPPARASVATCETRSRPARVREHAS